MNDALMFKCDAFQQQMSESECLEVTSVVTGQVWYVHAVKANGGRCWLRRVGPRSIHSIRPLVPNRGGHYPEPTRDDQR